MLRGGLMSWMGWWTTSCGFVILVLALAPAQADSPDGDLGEAASKALVEVGRKSFASNCASCHGLSAQGGGPTARALKTPPPDLTRIAARREGSFDVEELSRFIDGRLVPGAHGSREMPVWGSAFGGKYGGGETGDEISRGRIVALLEYLRTLQRD